MEVEDIADFSLLSSDKTKSPKSAPTSDQKSYCILCYFEFKCSTKLKKHRVRTHPTDEEKSTFDLDELKSFMLKLECSLCKKRFLNINSLKYHWQYGHSEKDKTAEKVACEFCKKEFKWKNRANLTKHIMSMHNIFYYDLDEYCFSKRTKKREAG